MRESLNLALERIQRDTGSSEALGTAPQHTSAGEPAEDAGMGTDEQAA